MFCFNAHLLELDTAVAEGAFIFFHSFVWHKMYNNLNPRYVLLPLNVTTYEDVTQFNSVP